MSIKSANLNVATMTGLWAASLLYVAPAVAQELCDEEEEMKELNEVVVQGVKVQKNAPFAVANVAKQTLDEHAKSGKELPILFTQTPGVQAWGENGLGTGSVYMRIRGAGDSRINVTLDGVPMNSPEDQCVFWANMNSYGSLLSNVQIQRGVGTSTNGDGAFGGTIALTSKAPGSVPSGEVSYSVGSYNTHNYGGSFSTGLIADHWTLDGAWHQTTTDGYVHGTDGRSGSYYAGLSYLGKNYIVRYKNFGNYEVTGQAWNGIDTGDLLDWNSGGMGTGIFGYKDIVRAGLGKYNTLYEHLVDGSDPSKGTERYQYSDGRYWERSTDNFWQNRNILSLAWRVNEHLSATASLHYTHGYGYYDEFRYNNKFSKFGLSNFTFADGTTIEKADFVRKKGMTQDCIGMLWSMNYKDELWDIVGGVAMQDFEANHFGYMTYVGSTSLSTQQNKELNDALRPNSKDYKYYDSDASKADQSMYIKALRNLGEQWSILADVQYRHVGYLTNGINDKFYDNGQNGYDNQVLNISEQYHFLNPKAGLNWHKDNQTAFLSFAMSHREPSRSNFTDNGKYPAPKAEKLLDYEAGYSYRGESWHADLTLYFMNYKDQFVQTGEVSDIGEALTTNIDKSYRTGIEIAAGWAITNWLTIEGNAALSKNVIKDFDEVVEDWDNWEVGTQTIHYDNSTLAMSPSVLLNGFVQFHKGGWNATWHTNYVSKQYLDNTECDQRSLTCFSVSDLSVSYTLRPKKGCLKEMVIGAQVNNIFDRQYAASGWVYSAIYASGGNPNENRYTEIGYIPQAGTTAMGSVTIKF